MRRRFGRWSALAEAAARVDQADQTAQAKTEEAGYFAQEHDRKQATLIHTQGELADAQDAIVALEQELLGHREDALTMARAIANVRDLEAAVRIFTAMCPFSEELFFLDDVYSSAADSGFRWPTQNPDKVWASFDKLRKAARQYHKGSPLKEALELAGVTPDDWAARVSDTAVSMYPERYRKTYQDSDGSTVSIVLGPHLKVGGKGNRGDAFRIYWSLESHAVHGPRFVVGHIGAKLKDSTGGY